MSGVLLSLGSVKDLETPIQFFFGGGSPDINVLNFFSKKIPKQERKNCVIM